LAAPPWLDKNMNAKIKVTFDMSFNDGDGECKTSVSFELVDHPEIPCPEKVKELVIEEIKMLCCAMGASGKQLFSSNDQAEARLSDSATTTTKKGNK